MAFRLGCWIISCILALLILKHHFMKTINRYDLLEGNLLDKEKYCINHSLFGELFSTSGIVASFLSNTSICLIHTFSTYIHQQAAMKLALNYSKQLEVMSPGIDINNGEINMIFRINDVIVQRNYLFIQTFNAMLHPINSGSILDLQPTFPFMPNRGQADPRMIRINSNTLLTYYYEVQEDEKHNTLASMYILDLNNKIPMNITINGSKERGSQKNWMAITLNNNLLFVYSLDPLILIKCTLDGSCFNIMENNFMVNIRTDKFVLRGGSPFQMYNKEYYVGVAHSMMKIGHKWRYESHIVVIHVNPFRFVYLSSPLLFSNLIFKHMLILPKAETHIFYPVGLLVESDDSIVITGHINDKECIILRLRGMQKLMNQLINIDKGYKDKGGPPSGFIHDCAKKLREKSN